MKKYVVTLLAVLSVLWCQSCSKGSESSDLYFKLAQDAFYMEEDEEKALELLNKQLEDTPSHLDSHYLRARIYWRADKNYAALRDLYFAIDHYKGNPMVYKSTLWGLRGAVYNDMGKYADAAESYRNAVKYAKRDYPVRVRAYYFDLAQALYKNDEFDEALKIYRIMLKDDSTDCAAMLGIARYYRDNGDYEESLKWLDKAESYDSTYGDTYKFKMQVLSKMERDSEAIDAAIKYYELDDDADVSYVADYVNKNNLYGLARVKAEMDKESADTRWSILLARIYLNNCDFTEALELFERIENEFGEDPMISYYKSDCYQEMGQFDKAIAEATKAIDLSDDNSFFTHRGDIYRSAGMYKEAIADYQKSMENDSFSGYEYYAIGWCHELEGDKTTALVYYSQGIEVDKTEPYLYVSRGDLLKEKGEINAANADYEKVLLLDTDPEEGSCRQYALHGLGRDQEAVEWMEKIIATKPNDSGRYYDQACLFARMNRTYDALSALRTAFEKGFRRFAHMEHDSDMDPLRNLAEYKAMLREYNTMPVKKVTEEQDRSSEPADALVSEIQMRKMPGGTYEVPCSINGLPLKFVLDTGASDVTLSSVEANFMLKNGYIKEKDFKGSRRYLTADGTIVNGSAVRIKEVKVGDVVMKNIDASVINNQKAPLLLGQSVMERFGTITIDNQNNRLIIKH